jgi:ABC transporter DrrB family efflux protein
VSTTLTTPDQNPVVAGRRSRPQPVTGHGPLYWGIADALVLAKRSLIAMPRVPELIAFSVIQPIMFVVLFRYVFGGAIQTPGSNYVDFLMPGIFVQTVAFGSIATGIGLAEDLQKGIIDRFRSLPMARSAVLVGRALSDLVRNFGTVIIIGAVGLAVGFRPHGSVLGLIAGFGVLLLFAFAFSWIAATVGLAVRSVEAAQSGGFIWLFPLVFASTAFVPLQSMPGWLQAFAAHQPISVTVDALRGLLLGRPVGTSAWQSLGWSLGIVAVFVPLSIARYRRAAS